MNKEKLINALELILEAPSVEQEELIRKLLRRLKTGDNQRTFSQNRALHLWMTKLAEAFNDAGYTVQLVLKEKVDLNWDMEKVKELLWRPAQQALLGKESTTSLKKLEDLDKVWEHLNRHLGQKFGIHVPFPSEPDPVPKIKASDLW